MRLSGLISPITTTPTTTAAAATDKTKAKRQEYNWVWERECVRVRVWVCECVWQCMCSRNKYETEKNSVYGANNFHMQNGSNEEKKNCFNENVRQNEIRCFVSVSVDVQSELDFLLVKCKCDDKHLRGNLQIRAMKSYIHAEHTPATTYIMSRVIDAFYGMGPFSFFSLSLAPAWIYFVQ